MIQSRTSCGIAALCAALLTAPAQAGTAADAATQIQTLMSYEGLTSLGVRSTRTVVEGCVFTTFFTAEDPGSGALSDGQITGDLNVVSATDITLRPNATFQEVYFLLPQASADWRISFTVRPGDPLFEALADDPNAMPHLATECDATSCFVAFDLGGGTDTHEMQMDLTDMVTPEDSVRLLEAFQNLADLCDGHVE